jgi:hypothetical protein
MSSIILFSLVFMLKLAVVVVLVRKYLQTRDRGFVWLGVAVIIWPGVSGVLEGGECLLIALPSGSHWGTFFPFNLVSSGRMTLGTLFTTLHLLQELVGIGLLLVAVLFLSKSKGDSKPQIMA